MERNHCASAPARPTPRNRGASSRVGARDKQKRQRFDDPSPVTIDGETAQDFDDAVAVRALRGGGFRLWVHIADVGNFIAKGDPVDQTWRAAARPNVPQPKYRDVVVDIE